MFPIFPKISNYSDKNMKNKTEIDYKAAIKIKFDKEKLGEDHDYFESPSPATLRELCLLKFDNGLNSVDQDIFRIYFKSKPNEDLRNSIYNFHIPKFKSIQSFLVATEKDKKTSILNLNLVAVLVDFNPRPFNKFLKNDSITDEFITESDTQNATVVEDETINKLEEIDELLRIKPKSVMSFNTNTLKKKIGFSIIGLLGMFSIGYTAKDVVFPEKTCMQWKEDHYELVDCVITANSFKETNKPEPYDEIEFLRKKLKVSDTTTFFNGNKPLVWYSKVNNVVEFFNMDGYNPENKDELKEITPHMIKNHVNSNRLNR